MFSIFAFVAVFFSLLAVALGGLLGYFTISKNSFKVGDIVRTTFTGSPAVLTTALWGINGEYDSAATYGFNFEQDAANALHCDMPQGLGTRSTWISDAGMNFKINPNFKNPPTYILSGSCSSNADCSKSSLQCGPGLLNGDDAIVNNNSIPSGQSLWNPRAHNPAVLQCPGISYCDLCGGPDPNPNGTDLNYCRTVADNAIGTCILTNSNIPWSCTEVDVGTRTESICAANIPSSKNVPEYSQFTSCSLLDNYSSLSFVATISPGTVSTISCSTSINLGYDFPEGYFCTLSGNVQCLQGQECVANWGSGPETGWSPATSTNYQTAANVCSGTVYPMVVLQTDWIAEGKISSISGLNYYIDWTRVQNTYLGTGPSDTLCSNSSHICQPPTKEQAADQSWVYSDCRFIKEEHPGSRHTSVSDALLGKADFEPKGLSIFSITDASFSDYNILNLLRVSTANTGQIQNVFTSSVVQPHIQYAPSSWKLSNKLTKDKLTKVFFYSIHPMQYSAQTTGWHTYNHYIFKNNLNLT